MSATMETVDLIASGYEFVCQKVDCEQFNRVIEISETVICSKCKTEYAVDNVEHAY